MCGRQTLHWQVVKNPVHALGQVSIPTEIATVFKDTTSQSLCIAYRLRHTMVLLQAL